MLKEPRTVDELRAALAAEAAAVDALRAERDDAVARAEDDEAELARLRADRAVTLALAVMALGPDAHEVLPAEPEGFLAALRAECLAVLPPGARSEEVAAYVREMCGRMLAKGSDR